MVGAPCSPPAIPVPIDTIGRPGVDEKALRTASKGTMRSWIRETLDDLRGAFRRPEPDATRVRFREIGFFFQFVRPVWGLGVLTLFLTLLGTALGSLLPLSTKAFIDFIILKEGFEPVERLLVSMGLKDVIPSVLEFLRSLQWLILAMAVTGGLMALMGISEQYLKSRFQQELTYNLQVGLFDHLLRFPLSFFKRRQVGYLVSRISDDVDTLKVLFSHDLSRLANDIFHLIFGAAILCGLSLRLTLIGLCLLPVYAILNVFFSGRLRHLSRTEMESAARIDRDVQEVLSGVELVKAYATEEKEVRRVSRTIRAAVRARIMAALLYFLTNYAVRGVQFLSTLVIMWFGAQEIAVERMTVGDYVAFTTYVIYLSGAVRSLSLFPTSVQPILACMDRLMELFRIIPEFGHERRDLVTLPWAKGEIRFQGVTFAYESGGPVLQDVIFTANPGDVIALVGPSGSGKTTLTSLILKFYRPQSGFILLDGHDLARIDARWLREQIGVVSQDIFLFQGTIEENIRYGRPNATLKEVMEAARRARIHQEIQRFPEGYETIVGERGATLSAGERQRISIARAFLKDPPILIFDEPTSALDPETESHLKASFRELSRNRTTFIISHRMSLLDVANRIFVLEKGRLREQAAEPATTLPASLDGSPRER